MAKLRRGARLLIAAMRARATARTRAREPFRGGAGSTCLPAKRNRHARSTGVALCIQQVSL
eukprot:COSAG02_NODE_8971_length_2378_cov_1.838964_1_plen_60_part_10